MKTIKNFFRNQMPGAHPECRPHPSIHFASQNTQDERSVYRRIERKSSFERDLKNTKAKRILAAILMIGFVYSHLQAELSIEQTQKLHTVFKEEYNHLSPLIGFAGKGDIEHKCRCKLKGKLGELINDFFYVRPDTSFGPTTTFFRFVPKPYGIGIMIGLVEKALRDYKAWGKITPEIFIEYFQKQCEFFITDKALIEHIANTIEKTENNLREKQRQINVLRLNEKRFKGWTKTPQRNWRELKRLKLQQAILLASLKKLKEQLSSTQNKGLIKKKNTKIENKTKVLKKITERIQYPWRIELEKKSKEALTDEEKKLIESTEQLEQELKQNISPLMRQKNNLEIRKWCNEQYKKIGKLVADFLFGVKRNDDQFCNEQDLINVFLVMLIYKSENKNDLIKYFEGLQSILGEDIFDTSTYLEFIENSTIYTKEDYEQIKKTYIQAAPKDLSLKTIEDLLLLYFGYFIFGAPFPPYHGMVVVSIADWQYTTCGETAAQQFWELLALINKPKKQFDFSILEKIKLGNIKIHTDVIEYFKKYPSINNTSERNHEWATTVCRGIPGVKYNKGDQYDIAGGVFNMINVLAYWFNITVPEKEEKEGKKVKYVFDKIAEALKTADIIFEPQDIPEIILEEPTKKTKTVQYKFHVEIKSSSRVFDFIWNFESNHFYLSKWNDEPSLCYEKIFDTLAAIIEKEKFLEHKDIINSLLLLSLCAHKDKERDCTFLVNSQLSDQTFKPYFSLLLSSPHNLLKNIVVDYLMNNTTTPIDHVRWVNNILPTVTDFDLLQPIIKNICKNAKTEFYPGVESSFAKLQNEDQKVKIIEIIFNNKQAEPFSKTLTKIIPTIVDERNKVSVLEAIANAKKIDNYKEDFFQILYKLQNPVDQASILKIFVETKQIAPYKDIFFEILNHLQNPDAQATVLTTFVETKQVEDYEYSFLTLFKNLQNSSSQASVLKTFIEKGQIKQYQDLFEVTFNNLKYEHEHDNQTIEALMKMIENKQAEQQQDLFKKTLGQLNSYKNYMLVFAAFAETKPSISENPFLRDEERFDKSIRQILVALIQNNLFSAYKKWFNMALNYVTENTKSILLTEIIYYGKPFNGDKELFEKLSNDLTKDYKEILQNIITTSNVSEKQKIKLITWLESCKKGDLYNFLNSIGVYLEKIILAIVYEDKIEKYKDLFEKILTNLPKYPNQGLESLKAIIEKKVINKCKNVFEKNINLLSNDWQKTLILEALIQYEQFESNKELFVKTLATINNREEKEKLRKIISSSKLKQEEKEELLNCLSGGKCNIL